MLGEGIVKNSDLHSRTYMVQCIRQQFISRSYEPMAEKRKLTVRVDNRWIEAAKDYAERHDTSLSKLISEFLRNLPGETESYRQAPILRRISGILPADISIREHRAHLDEKYGIREESTR